jgi:hypothetical protein
MRNAGVWAVEGKGRESGSCEVEARKEEEVDAVASSTTTDEAYTCNPLTPFSGYGRRGSSASLALLDNTTALPAQCRLASDPKAPVTRSFPFYRADS